MNEKNKDGASPWTERLPTAEQVRAWAAEGTIPVPWIAVALIAFFPLGLYLVWKHSGWPTKAKGIWTGAWAVSFVLGMWLVAPLLIFLTLLGAFGVAFCVIWSSSSLAHDKKIVATGGAVGGLLLCLFVEFAIFSIRAYNAEKEEQRKKYAEENVRDKEKARQKEETIRQKLTEANQAWASGDKAKAIALYRECIELGLSQGSEASAVYQRVIEQDVSTGNLSPAKALIHDARRWKSIELAFTDQKCNDLLKEVEMQIAEEKRVDDEKRAATVGNNKTLLVGKWATGTPPAVQVDEFTADGRYILSFNGAVATTTTYKFINTDTIEIKSNPTLKLKISISGDELTETDAKGKTTRFQRVPDGNNTGQIGKGEQDDARIMRQARTVMKVAKIGASPEDMKSLMRPMQPTSVKESILDGKKSQMHSYGTKVNLMYIIREDTGEWGLLGARIDGNTVLPEGDL
jgi:hypothetical protein